MSSKESKERCVGDYIAVWRIKYEFQQRIIRSVPGTGETETVGWQPATETFDVVALTPELASAAYSKRFPIRDTDSNYYVKLLSGPEFLCYVDAMVSLQ